MNPTDPPQLKITPDPNTFYQLTLKLTGSQFDTLFAALGYIAECVSKKPQREHIPPPLLGALHLLLNAHANAGHPVPVPDDTVHPPDPTPPPTNHSPTINQAPRLWGKGNNNLGLRSQRTDKGTPT